MDLIICGDALKELKKLSENSVDSVITDPPAGISFMGNDWDKDKGGRDNWINWLSKIMIEAIRVLKPGGHALVWALPRTSHWTAFALENAGFEIRDCIYYIFGSGFPKSLDISKAIDKHFNVERVVTGLKHPEYKDGIPGGKGFHNSLGRDGGERMEPEYKTVPTSAEAKQWSGWGTGLKPAVECWWLCRKPLSEKTIVENVLKWGTGGINIDECRVETEDVVGWGGSPSSGYAGGLDQKQDARPVQGRFPANLIHDGSDEVLEEFAKAGEKRSGKSNNNADIGIYTKNAITPMRRGKLIPRYDVGTASRFFYCAKASSKERKEYNNHVTVKPLALMKYLIALITPKNGIILDPFMGSGSTGVAAKMLSFDFIGIEINPEYVEIAKKRIESVPKRRRKLSCSVTKL